MMPIMTDITARSLAESHELPHHFEIYNAEPHSYKDLPSA